MPAYEHSHNNAMSIVATEEYRLTQRDRATLRRFYKANNDYDDGENKW